MCLRKQTSQSEWLHGKVVGSNSEPKQIMHMMSSLVNLPGLFDYKKYQQIMNYFYFSHNVVLVTTG